jgi:hypothetical protein
MLFAETRARSISYENGYQNIKGEHGPSCGAISLVPSERAAVLDKLIAPREIMRAQAPTFVREQVLHAEAMQGRDDEREPLADDLVHVLAAYTLGYLEWPHIDGRFDQVFDTMAGRIHWEWAGSQPEADGTSPLENDKAPRPTPRGFGR